MAEILVVLIIQEECAQPDLLLIQKLVLAYHLVFKLLISELRFAFIFLNCFCYISILITLNSNFMFEELTKEEMITLYGGAQEVGDIDRTQPNKIKIF